MKTLIGYLYVVAVISGLFGFLFSLIGSMSFFMEHFNGDSVPRPLDTFIYREGMLFLVSIGILMIAHIGINLADVFEEESTENPVARKSKRLAEAPPTEGEPKQSKS